MVVLLTIFSTKALALMTVEPPYLNFGPYPVDSSIQLDLQFSFDNTDGYTDWIDSITVTRDSGFSVNHNCSANSTTCSAVVTFSPTTAGEYSAVLSISGSRTSDVDFLVPPESTEREITLTGTGQSADFVFDSSGVNFGTLVLGQISSSRQVTVSNPGNIDALISEIATTGDFSQTNDCPSDSLVAGGSCVIEVTYSAAALGNAEGTLTISGLDHQGNVSRSIPLTGRAARGVLSASADTIQFPETSISTVSQTELVTVSNSGDYPLADLSISLTGEFDQSNDCPATLAPGSSCEVSVNAVPNTVGELTGDLVVSAFNGLVEQTQSVSLTVLATRAVLEVSATALTFSDTEVGASSAVQTLTLTNSGDAAFVVNSLTIEGDFSQSNDCGDEIPAAESCSVEVLFTPQQTGQRSGTLSIESELGATLITLSGATTGSSDTPSDPSDPSDPTDQSDLALSTSEIIFSDSPVDGASQPETLTLSNQSSAALSFNSISVIGDFTLSDTCGSEIGAGESCDIEVVFAPKSTGSAVGTLTIDSSLGISRVALWGSSSTVALPAEDAAEIVELFSAFTGGSANIASTGEAIADSCTSGRISNRMQQDCNDIVSAASDGDTNTGTALEEITPESSGKANNVTRQGGETQTRNLGSRISALRAGVRGLSFSGLDWRIGGENLSIALLEEAYRRTLRQGGGASADEGSIADARLGLFVTGDIGSGSKEESDLESGLDFTTYGLTLGMDYRISDQFILGSAFGFIDTQAELNSDTGELDTQGYSLSLYGTYYSSGDYFLDFAATYGHNGFDQKRQVAYQLEGLSEVEQELFADYDGDMFSLFIGSGYDFNRVGWSFGPRLDLEYIRSKVDEFSEASAEPESSGAGWATRVDAMEQTWLTLSLGGRVGYAYSADWGVLSPYLRVDWLHEFKDDSQTITAYFLDDPAGQAIEITTDDPDRDYLRLRIGASAQFQDGLAGFIDFGTLMAHSQWQSRNLSLGIRKAF
jgi:outer membrane autotransporter protein